MKIHTSTMYIIGILIILLIAGMFLLKNTSTKDLRQTSETTTATATLEMQKVVIGVKNYNYYPNTISIKSGQPVSLSLDSSVSGCLRDFTIRSIGVSKFLKTPQDTVEFTIAKPGTHTFACSMGMGTGTLIVT